MVGPGVSVISISRLQALGLVSESLDLLYLLPELSPCEDVPHPPQGRDSCALRTGPCVLGRKGRQFLDVKAASRGRAALTRGPACRVLFCQAIPGAGLTPGQRHCGRHGSLVSQHSSFRSQEETSEHIPRHRFCPPKQHRNMGGDISRRKII